MSSSSDANTIALLTNVGIQINRTLGIFIFIFGVIGNLLNILILRQRLLRSNPCSWLFFMSSIASLATLIFGFITRILSGWNLDFTTYNSASCKCRAFLVFTSLNIALWLIALATIDRWLSSSILVERRRKSTLKNAQRGTIIVVCLSVILYIQMPICYEANVMNAPLKCYSKSIPCRLITDMSLTVISILCPLFFMVFFGILTVSNVRQTHRRIHQRSHIQINTVGHENQLHNVDNHRFQHKKMDRQLLMMLLLQVTLLTILTLPLSIQRFYSTWWQFRSQTALQVAIDSFFSNIALVLFYTAHGLSFYIYTLSGGTVFRKAILDVFKKIHLNVVRH